MKLATLHEYYLNRESDMEDRLIPVSFILQTIAEYIARNPEVKDSGKSNKEILALAIGEKIDLENYNLSQVDKGKD